MLLFEGHTEHLGEGEIERVETRSDHGVSRRRAVRGRTGEGVRVEPGGGGSVFEAGCCALDGVGPWPERVVVPCVAALENIERPSTGHGDERGYGPAAE